MGSGSETASSPSLDRAVAALSDGEYAARLGFRPTQLARARATVAMPFAETIVNRGGKVHGGALASLLIAAARIAAAASERPDSARRIRLLSANIAFLSAPRRGPLVAEASVVRRGRDIAHVSVNASDDEGTNAATAAIAVGLVDPDVPEDLKVPGHRAFAPDDIARASPVPGSPYLSAAGVMVLPSSQRSSRAVLPRIRNRATDPDRVDDGAIAGLADSCAAYAAHLCAPQSHERGGMTVSMALTFQSSRDEDLIGVGAVSGRAAGCYLATVDVTGLRSRVSVASGLVVYRLPG